MFIIWILAGGALLYFLQDGIYRRFWAKGLDAVLAFSKDTAVAGEECFLLETVENRKILPLPAVKVKFQISRDLHFADESSGSVSDQYYRNDIMSLGPHQRVTRKIPFICGKRGYYPIHAMDLVCSNLFLSREMIRGLRQDGLLYVYPYPAESADFLAALKKLSGEMAVKRHVLEDPFEYIGIREYAPFDEMRTINWKATARTEELMVNVRGYTAMQEVRILMNLEDRNVLSERDMLEAGMNAAARIVDEFTAQGIRVSFYANAGDCLTGEMLRIGASTGDGHREQIMRAMARLDLDHVIGDGEALYNASNESGTEADAIVLISAARDESVRNLARRLSTEAGAFVWYCPLTGTMDGPDAEAEELHFVRLDGWALLEAAKHRS